MEIIETQFEAVVNEFKVRAIKTGMLYSPEIVELIGTKLEAYLSNNNIPLIVDPVLVATTGKELSKGSDFVEALKTHLIPQSTVLMPNLHEAGQLLGHEVITYDDMRSACTDLAVGLGCGNVLLKGGHALIDSGSRTLTPDAIDILYRSDPDLDESRKFIEVSSPRYPQDVHGSGCTYSSLLAGLLAKGLKLEPALREAKSRITEFIVSGSLLTVPFGDEVKVKSGEEGLVRVEIIEDLNNSVEKLKIIFTSQVIPILMPEVGINIGYALPNARAKEDICALEGRLVRLGDAGVATPGSLKFGASNHVAAVILAAMGHDNKIRAVMNIKYREKVINAVNKAGLTSGMFNRAEEPGQVSTMEWGTSHVISELGSVPDVIYDKGGIGKEPMVRIFGSDPQDVIYKLQKIIDNL